MSLSEKGSSALSSIQQQIEKFDNKANILISVIGIIFAISLSMLEVFSGIKETDKCKYIWLLVISILYFASFAFEMIFLLAIIYPRKKKDKTKIAVGYYLDSANLTNDEIKQYLTIDNTENEILNQISTNAKICRRKHIFTKLAIWTLIPLFLFMFAMFFISIV